MALPVLLAGPILRRAEPTSLSVWLAFSAPQSVSLFIWEEDKGVRKFVEVPEEPPGQVFANEHPDFKVENVETIRVGQNLHLALVTLDRSNATRTLLRDKNYSYNVVFKNGGATRDLHSEGLLQAETDWGFSRDSNERITSVNTRRQLPLGYDAGCLPSFVLPAGNIKDLVLAHGSCRKMHGIGDDAMAHIDRLIETAVRNPETANPPRIQSMFLTGDQFYADEVPRLAIRYFNQLGRELFGEHETLRLRVQTTGGAATFESVAADMNNVPPDIRRYMLVKLANFTTPDGEGHLMSLGEFSAAYLYYWSLRAWDDKFIIELFNLKEGREDVVDDTRDFIIERFDNIPEPLAAEILTGFDGFTFKDKDDKDAGLIFPKKTEAQLGADLFERYEKKRQEYVDGRKGGLVEECRNSVNFLLTMPRVQRLLANVPTTMMFDDHEITDDWNIMRKWKNEVYTTALGPNVLRNGLMAYALFQDWGNTPTAYLEKKDNPATPGTDESTPQNPKFELLQAIKTIGQSFSQPNAPPDATLNQVDEWLGLAAAPPLIEWHFGLELGEAWIQFLDTRTRRDFPPGLIGFPDLLPEDVMKIQLPELLTTRFDPKLVFVVSPLPALSLPMIEELGQPLVASIEVLFKGQEQGDEGIGFSSIRLKRDFEQWGFNPPALERLLQRLERYKRVVLLSGDIHFGHSSVVDFWKKGSDEPSARFIQLVASSFKNAWPMDHRIFKSGFAERLLSGFDEPVEKHVWKDHFAIDTTGDIAPRNHARLFQSPVVLAKHTWRPGATISPEPDYRYRFSVPSDEREFEKDNIFKDPADDSKYLDLPEEFVPPENDPEAPIPENLKMPPEQYAKLYPKILERFADRFIRGRSRRLVWGTHMGVITFSETDKPSGGGKELSLNHRFFQSLLKATVFEAIEPAHIHEEKDYNMSDHTVHTIPINPAGPKPDNLS